MLTTTIPHLQRYDLDLGKMRPDHFTAQLLVEQELQARQHKSLAFYSMTLGGTVHRCVPTLPAFRVCFDFDFDQQGGGEGGVPL